MIIQTQTTEWPSEQSVVLLLAGQEHPTLAVLGAKAVRYRFDCRCLIKSQSTLESFVHDPQIKYIATVKPHPKQSPRHRTGSLLLFHAREVVSQLLSRQCAINTPPLVRLKLPQPDYFSIEQTAEICDVAPGTVEKWFNAGELRGYRKKSQRRIPKDNLRQFLIAHGMGPGLHPRKSLAIGKIVTICDISPATAQRLFDEGKFPGGYWVGGDRRVPVEGLRQFLVTRGMSTDLQPRRSLTTGQVAQICGVTLPTIKRWCNRSDSGKLASYRITTNRQILVPTLIEYLREHQMTRPLQALLAAEGLTDETI